MLVFTFNFQEITFELFGSKVSGEEALFVDGVEVSRKRNFKTSTTHDFESPLWGPVSFQYKIHVLKHNVDYSLQTANGELTSGQCQLAQAASGQVPTAPSADAARGDTLTAENTPLPPATPPIQKRSHLVTWGALALKLFKSAKVVKVALAGMALSGWSILFSWEFACVLLATIVFHEYGHLKAMQKFGIKTKGMYLIPFVGGVAVGDRAKTHWQDVYISMMGPVFGLFMSITFFVIYQITGNHFCGLVASISALINVFNLLPIHPLDGGQVLKALVFSGRTRWAVALMLFISALGFALAVHVGLVFICFFIVIGVIDILADWRRFTSEDKTKLTVQGIGFSLIWYLATIVVFLALITSIASNGLPGSEIALRILQS